MRRGRTFLFLAFFLIVILALVYFVLRPGGLLGGGGEPSGLPVEEQLPTATPIPTTNVVVVVQEVERGETLTEEKLDMVPYQNDLVLPIMFTDINEVIGQTARFNMAPYTVVTTALVTDIMDQAQGSDDALFITPGMVAVSIPITRLSSVSYAPQRGDHVNVIVTLLFVDLDQDFQTILPNWTGNVIAPGGGGMYSGGTTPGDEIRTMMAQPFRGTSEWGRPYDDITLEETFYLLPSEAQRPRLVSQTLIQNVIVLQMGDFPTPEERRLLEQPLEPTPTPGPEAAAQQPQEEATPEAPPPPPDVLTLIVSPQDAVTLNYLVYSGAQLTLVLRNPRDTSTVVTEAATLSFLLSQYNIPIPVKLPYGFQPAVSQLAPMVLPNDVTPTPNP